MPSGISAMNVFESSSGLVIAPNKNFFGFIGDKFGGVADRVDVWIRVTLGVDWTTEI